MQTGRNKNLFNGKVKNRLIHLPENGSHPILMVSMSVRILILILLGSAITRAAEPTRPAATTTVVTNYFSINGMHAPCCAVMLKYALTNLSGVASADIYFTNKITRIIHQPDKETMREIRNAFRSEIVDAFRLKKQPAGKLQ